MSKSFTAQQSYYFKARPQKVFQALTEPTKLTKWFLSKAKLDPKKGGSYTFDWIGGYRMRGRVKRFDTDKAVSFSWHDKIRTGKMVETTASFRLARKGKGTLLKLRHTGFHDPEHFAECSSRWAYYLTNMKSVVDREVDLRSRYDW